MAAALRYKVVTILQLVISVFIVLPYAAHSRVLDSFRKLQFSSISPESLAFDPKGRGPYTGVIDGRILKYLGPKRGFVDFAFISSNRTKRVCDGKTDKGPSCGRPLGIEFNHKTGDLYITDSYNGLMVVGPKGGVATPLALYRPHLDLKGLPDDLPDSVDVNPVNGDVFMTYIGHVFAAANGDLYKIFTSNDTSGRLFKYDPKTKEVTVVLQGLAGAAGVAVSKNGKFVLVTEYIARRVRKFWLKGPKANTSEILVNLKGNPDNIKRTRSGHFWVAVTIQQLEPKSITIPFGQRINGRGRILETLRLDEQYPATPISDVREYKDSIYVGSVSTNFIGQYRIK